MARIKKSPGAVHDRCDTNKSSRVLSAPGDPVVYITVLHRERRFMMEQRKRADLALGAFLRGALGWRKDLPDAERKAIAVRAAAVAKDASGTPWEMIVQASNASRAPFEAVEDINTKQMAAIVKTLPTWQSFGEEIRGFGAVSFATIIAETGDLSNYATIARLWKRMGLAVMGDVRQGGLPKGTSAEAWVAHGYSPSRRSAMWNIGDTMLKAQVRKVKNEAGEDTGERTSLGKYGAIYLARKEYELARDSEMRPIKAHRRAQRYMEKRLLKDLWQAWRRDRIEHVERPVENCSDAELIAA